jgi:hypothetical protein
LSTFEKMRDSITQDRTIINLVHIG